MIYSSRTDILSWGRIQRGPQNVSAPRFQDELCKSISAAPNGKTLAIGMRRSYGDTVLNSSGGLVDMRAMDRLIAFDEKQGTLCAEAGVTLSEIICYTVPRGFFIPVSPGTRFVSLGGAIANDVHGKNHHRAGTFGRHITSLGLVRSDGTFEIGPEKKSDLFSATIGGLGLTGMISWAEIKLHPIRSAFLDVEILPFETLEQFWTLAEASEKNFEHTVAWIDSTAQGSSVGRGIFSRANWCAEGSLAIHEDNQMITLPCEMPSGLLNRFTVSLFNHFYFATQKRKTGQHNQHYTTFFHPLDSLGNWNRLYGHRGFWQYQCMIPKSTMREAVPELIRTISRCGEGSFLAVLKTCGNLPSPGLLSFPMEGATLALDFPNRGEITLKVFSHLDTIVKEAQGRLYAAKDGRIPKEMWQVGYPKLQEFVSFMDPHMTSDFWKRVSA